VLSYYKYTDRVYAILNYRRLLQKPKLLKWCVLRSIRYKTWAVLPPLGIRHLTVIKMVYITISYKNLYANKSYLLDVDPPTLYIYGHPSNTESWKIHRWPVEIRLRPTSAGLQQRRRPWPYSVAQVSAWVHEQLFSKINCNSLHILQQFLPKRPSLSYSFRPRSHNKTLIIKSTQLNDRDFLIRSIYKDSYGLLTV